MARVQRPPKEHPDKATIETGLAGALGALGALLVALTVAHAGWTNSGVDVGLFVFGVICLLCGAYVFAQYWFEWLPSIPAPRERVRKPGPSEAQQVAKDILKEEGLWPRWWQLRRRLGGGLTVDQYEAIRAREIAANERKRAVEVAAKPAPTPPLQVDTGALVRRIAELGQTAQRTSHRSTLDQLVARGAQLRKAATARPSRDAYTQQFQPMSALASAMANAAPIPPYEVNVWLESVARFVGENFAHHYEDLQQASLRKRDPKATVSAIDRNLSVLKKIESEI